MKLILIITLLFSQLAACTHADKKFDSHISHQECDEALKNLPNEDPLNKTGDQVKYVAGNVASYSATGVGYTTQVLWNITTGTILFVGICAPVILSAASGASVIPHGYPGAPCLPISMKDSGLFAPPLGKKVWKGTSELRCPNLKGVSDSLQKVASCYESKGDMESIKKAVNSLENIEMSKHFFSCLSPEEQTQIGTHREALKKKLSPEALLN